MHAQSSPWVYTFGYLCCFTNITQINQHCVYHLNEISLSHSTVVDHMQLAQNTDCIYCMGTPESVRHVRVNVPLCHQLNSDQPSVII